MDLQTKAEMFLMSHVTEPSIDSFNFLSRLTPLACTLPLPSPIPHN